MLQRNGIFLGLAAQCLLSAQQMPPSVSGPRLGYVLDPALHRLAPLLGIPGAARHGEPLAGTGEITAAAVAPDLDYALIGTSTAVNLLRFDAAGRIESIATLADRADKTWLSPAGGAAVLYRGSGNSPLVITGLPEAPSFAEIALPPETYPLAVSDAGDVLAAGSAVFLLRAGSAPRQLALAGQVTAAAFGRHTPAMLIASGPQLLAVQPAPDGFTYRTLASDLDTPVAVAFTDDGSRAIAAAATAEIAVFDLSSGTVSRAFCRCAPSRLDRLHGNSIFRLNDASQGLLWLLDAGGDAPRLWFVPRRIAE